MNQSPAREIAERFASLGPVGHKALDLVLDHVDVIELAALAHDWIGTWARPNQVIDVFDSWKTHGFLTGRRFGKSRANCEFVIGEAMSGRAMRIGFCAQSEERTRKDMIDGDAGLIACSPSWFRARFENGRIIWPNGAQAFPHTPEVPQGFRGPGYQLFWASEVQSWPASTREEAFTNAQIMATLGYARLVWDATPKKRHPILRALIAKNAAHPDRYRIVRGLIEENRDNLGDGAIEELRASMTGSRAREELDGVFLDDADDALFRQSWIDSSRRALPERALPRRVLALDPAISDRKGTDETGLVDAGLGADNQVYVIADYSKRYAWEEWGKLVLDLYFRNDCDCVVVERNRGGDAVVANLRAIGRDRGVAVELVEKGASTRHVLGTVYVKEVFSRSSKETRAEPVASAYEAGRVSHVRGADLLALEDELTTWVPEASMRSPNRLDALVFAVHELANLGEAERKLSEAAMVGPPKPFYDSRDRVEEPEENWLDNYDRV